MAPLHTSRKQKKNNAKRKLKHSWLKSQESRLILAVHSRNELWECGDPRYKLSQVKQSAWQEVAEELNIEVVDWEEAKNKWNSMRSNFKSYMVKFRSKASGVTWPHFEEMMFVESAKKRQSTASTSTLSLENAYTDSKTNLDNLSQMPLDFVGESKPTRAHYRKRTATITASPPSPAPSSSCSYSMKDLAAHVLSNLNARPQTDRFTAFGEVIAGHLRRLDSNDAEDLESKISRLMYDFLASRRAASVQPTMMDISLVD